MDSSIERLFEEAIKERIFPGASLLVGTPEKILLEGVWGAERYGGLPIEPDTWFDLASLTKPLVTTVLCMRAIGDGKLQLDDTLARFYPECLLPADKRSITVRHLLNHCSGLPAHEPYYRDLIRIPPDGRASALLSWILRAPTAAPPGAASAYSDLGFMLLGMVLEMLLMGSLDLLASRWIFEPLGLDDALGFRRIKAPEDPRILPESMEKGNHRFAATEKCPWRNRLLVGEVDDENAYCLGGVAGHAGLFGSARGIYECLRFLFHIYRGEWRESPWNPEIVRLFWEKRNMAPGSTWALGFDTPSPTNSSAGVYFSPKSVGHLGFTGTSFWMDLEREAIVILLTNRVHPSRGNGAIKQFRPMLHNIVMETFVSSWKNGLARPRDSWYGVLK